MDGLFAVERGYTNVRFRLVAIYGSRDNANTGSGTRSELSINNPEVRTRLVLVHRSHASAMFQVLVDSELYEFTGGEPPRSVTDVDEWFSALETRLSPDGSERWLTWIVQLTECSTSIGYVQATVKGDQADLAWLIGVNWQGQGYATEALQLLVDLLAENEVKTLTAHIHPNHEASQRLAAGIGLHRTPLLHDGEEIWSN